MSKVAVFPGSFDPFTIGHHSVVSKALPLFDKVVIAIGQNSTKTPAFDLEKRETSIRKYYSAERKIEVVTFTGLTVDLCKHLQAKFIVRGLRNGTDFDYEKSIAHMNTKLVHDIETIFFITEPEYDCINSTIVREIYKNGGDIKQFLPKGFNF